MKYYVQQQAPASNWVDIMGSDDIDACKRQATYYHEVHKDTVRIIERQDKVVWEIN